jgi:hypothetical protein
VVQSLESLIIQRFNLYFCLLMAERFVEDGFWIIFVYKFHTQVKPFHSTTYPQALPLQLSTGLVSQEPCSDIV